MPDDEIVTLKTGVELRAISVIANLGYLRGMLGGLPNGEVVITDFYHFCNGEPERVRPESLAVLIQRRDLLQQADGHLEPDDEGVKQVLLATFQQTPEGVVLVNPVQPSTGNRDALERARRTGQTILDDLLRGEGPDPDEPVRPGRS